MLEGRKKQRRIVGLLLAVLNGKKVVEREIKGQVVQFPFKGTTLIGSLRWDHPTTRATSQLASWSHSSTIQSSIHQSSQCTLEG
mmetsp:Transcript_20162/g.28402  ORF Transcript_20162/g.28402 Transcript_20162/m.28402 type:complete len:84 (-) Transcript_20162:94-345(-)